MKKRVVTAAAAALALGVPGAATAASGTWGQEVRDCNHSSCYPGAGNRGSYVSQQARDGQGPGYGYEIQTLAQQPRNHGSSNPNFR